MADRPKDLTVWDAILMAISGGKRLVLTHNGNGTVQIDVLAAGSDEISNMTRVGSARIVVEQLDRIWPDSSCNAVLALTIAGAAFVPSDDVGY